MDNEPKAKIFEEAGKGRKQCPGCQKYIAARSQACPGCGHEFGVRETTKTAKTSEPEPAEPTTPRVYVNRNIRTILTPAGKCPVAWRGSTFDEVQDWAMKVVERGYEEGVQYSPSAVRFFVRQFVPISTPEYNEVMKHLAEFHADQAEV